MKRIVLLALVLVVLLAACQAPPGGTVAPDATVTPSADTGDGLY